MKMMKTTRLHRFLCATILGAATAFAFSAHAQDVNARTAPFGHGLADTHPAGQAAKQFAADMDQATGGKMKIAVIANQALGPDPQMLGALQGGVQEFYTGSALARNASASVAMRSRIPRSATWSASPLNSTESAGGSTVVQPMCGRLCADRALTRPGHWANPGLTSPCSSPDSNMICIPTQIPRTGRPPASRRRPDRRGAPGARSRSSQPCPGCGSG